MPAIYSLLRWALLVVLHMLVGAEAQAKHWVSGAQQAVYLRIAWLAKVLPWPLSMPLAWLLPEPVPRSGKAPGPPQAVAIVVSEASPSRISLAKAAEVVGWCASMGLTHVCVYDPEGQIRGASGNFAALLDDTESAFASYSYAVEVGYSVSSAADPSEDAAAAVQPVLGAARAEAAGRSGLGKGRIARAIQVRLLSGRDSHALVLAAAREGPPLDWSLQLGRAAGLPGMSPAAGQLRAAPGSSGQLPQLPGAPRRQRSADLARARAAPPALCNGGPYDDDVDDSLPIGSGGSARRAAAAVANSYRPGSAPGNRPFSGYAAASSMSKAALEGPCGPLAAPDSSPSAAAQRRQQDQLPNGFHADAHPAPPRPPASPRGTPAAPDQADAAGRGAAAAATVDGSGRRRSGGYAPLEGSGPIRRVRPRRAAGRGGGLGAGADVQRLRATEDDFAAFVSAARSSSGMEASAVLGAPPEPDLPRTLGATQAAAGGAGAAESGIRWGALANSSGAGLALDADGGAVSNGSTALVTAAGVGTPGAGAQLGSSTSGGGGDTFVFRATSRGSSAARGPAVAPPVDGAALWRAQGRLFRLAEGAPAQPSAQALLSAFNRQLAAQNSLASEPLTPAQLGAQMAALAGPEAVREPDLVLVFGKVFSLAGFPPWPLRFSEMYHLGELQEATPQKILNALQRYCRTSQRFGA